MWLAEERHWRILGISTTCVVLLIWGVLSWFVEGRITIELHPAEAGAFQSWLKSQHRCFTSSVTCLFHWAPFCHVWQKCITLSTGDEKGKRRKELQQESYHELPHVIFISCIVCIVWQSPDRANTQWALLGSHTPLQEHSEIKQDGYAQGITWGLLQNQFILLTILSQFLPEEKAFKEHILCIRAITKLQGMLHKNPGQFVKSLNWGASLYFLKKDKAAFCFHSYPSNTIKTLELKQTLICQWPKRPDINNSNPSDNCFSNSKQQGMRNW